MKQRFLHIIFLAILALAWSGGAWAQWTSGQGTYKEGKWYVLYEGENSIGTIGSKEFTLLGPGTNLTFDAKRDPTAQSNLKVDKYVNGSYTGNPFFNQNPGTVTKTGWFGIETEIAYASYGPFSVSDATKIKFYTETGATLKKYFKNIKVPMAQYINNPSATELVFEAGMVDDEATTKNFTIFWCNVPAMTYSVTGTNSTDVNVTITNNSEAGKYNTATVNVTYKRKIAGSLNATLTISNTYGSYSKTIALTGSSTKYDQTISWNNESAINTSLKVDDTQTISASATSDLGVTYTSSNTNVLTVNSSGIITAVGAGTATITVSQSGNYKYNAASSITKTFTVSKYDQTITWTNPSIVNIVSGVTSDGAAAATAPGGTVTYESSDETIATVNSNGDVTGVAASIDPVTITARQSGNYKYNAVESTRQFTVINKFQPTFDASGFRISSGDNYTSYVDDAPTITVANTTSGFTYNSSDPTIVSISKSGDVITLTALKVGTSTVTLNDPGNTTHYSASATYNITVTKVPNGLAASLASLTANPDGTIAVTFTGKNNTGTAIVGTITNQVLSSSVNNGSDVITYADGVITAKNAGTAKITFTQAATDKYAAWTSSTYDITVTKLSNPISITLAGGSSTNIKLKYGATATLSYTTANTTGVAPTVTRTSGSYTTYSSGTITAGNAQGTDIYEIRQTESYKYEAGLASFTIRVNNSDETVGYVLYDETEYSHGTGSGVMHQYTLSGPGETLSYEATRALLAIYYNLYVETSPDNSTWTQIQDNQDLEDQKNWREFSKGVSEDARYVRFRFPAGGTSVKYLRNTKVTRKTYVRESHDTTKDNLGTVYTGSTATSATITVSYSSTNGGNINISSNNSHFVPSISEIAVESNKKATNPGGTEYICGVDGTRTFTVTYTPDPNSLGEETATITIGDLFYSQTITLTATAAKRANTLTVVGEQTLKVDDVVSNVFSGKNSDATLTATWSRDGVATFDVGDNEITAIGEGTATLTLTQLENDYHYGTTKTVKVNVSKYDQTLTWVNNLDADARTLEVGDELTTNTATASSGLTVTYSSSNPSALEVNATTGALTAKDGGANIIITATQAGNYKFNAASITRTFTVIKREYVTVTTSLTAGTNLFPLEGDNITIRTDALITESALTIADETIVTASFGSNTFTLMALKEGTTTVRLVREQTEDFFALDVTYTIRVVKPALALDPTATPVISHDEYSSVTLNRTLKAGYSTIALPFDTDVSELVAGRNEAYDSSADWVAQLSAVTNSVADGYTLYFQKVENGVIEANQPYVLHLGTQVVNPTWTDLENGIGVEEAEATSVQPATGYSGYAGWKMWSNFTPNFPMDGKYGIVNNSQLTGTDKTTYLDGGLMLGSGSSAKLNAFTAYITAPQANPAPRLRVAYVDTDGTTTFIGSLPEEDLQGEPVAIYGPDGQRRSKMQRGVNIVRFADGTTRKVQY